MSTAIACELTFKKTDDHYVFQGPLTFGVDVDGLPPRTIGDGAVKEDELFAHVRGYGDLFVFLRLVALCSKLRIPVAENELELEVAL